MSVKKDQEDASKRALHKQNFVFSQHLPARRMLPLNMAIR